MQNRVYNTTRNRQKFLRKRLQLAKKEIPIHLRYANFEFPPSKARHPSPNFQRMPTRDIRTQTAHIFLHNFQPKTIHNSKRPSTI